MAIQAGQAYIQVVPSLRGWGADVRRQLQRELSGVKGKVPIEPDFDGVKQESQRKGNEAGGEFARSFRRRVEAALKALPDVEIGADSTEAQREIGEIRRELQTLSEKTVGIDIDAGQATAQIQRLKARLDQLSAESASVEIDVDVGAASAQLAAINRQVDRIDGKRANVSVDVDRDGNAQRASFFLTQQVNGLVLAGAGIAPVFVPAFAAAGAAALGFAGSLAGASAGVGALVAVALPAFSAVSDAVKATDQAEKAAATSAVNTTRQRTQAAFQAQQAAARVADAQRQADRTAVDGAKRVQDAQRALGDTRRDVADRIRDANERVGDSERALQRAHEAVRRAQEQLTEARREAVRVLQDLREQSSDLVRSEARAEIDLIEARQRLAEVNRDATATQLDRRKAALDVLDAEDRLSDVQRDQKRTREELSAAERAGINGSDQVVAASDRLRDAQRGVADARRDSVEAQQDLARAEADGARAIADAERAVSDARTEAAQANADAARAVADAFAAQRQQAELARLEAENGIAANRNLAFAMGELTPMQKQLYDGFINLRSAFTEWARALEPAVLPLFIDAMKLIERALPLLSPLVLAAAGAFDYLLDRASAALDSPFWQRFIDFLTAQAPGAIVAFGESLGNIARGLGGILIAFGVFSGDLNDGLVDLTERFADWGENLADNPGFHRFVDFVRTTWPALKDTILAVADAFAAIVEALAPIGGGPVLTVIREIAEWIADMDPSTIQAIAFALGAIALAMKAIGIGAAIAAIGPWGVAILAIAAAVAFAYFKFEGFREIISDFVAWVQEEVVPRLQAFGEAIARLFEEEIRPRLEQFWEWFQREIVPVLQDIGDAVVEVFRRVGEWFERNWPAIQDFIEGWVSFLQWAWDAVIFPVLEALWKFLSEKLGPKMLWLWHEVIEPAWKVISAIISWAWQYVIGPVLKALAWFIENILVPVIIWFWTTVGPIWLQVANVISFVWQYVIKPVFDAIAWVITNVLAPIFSWLWREIIVPVWQAISDAISWAWRHVIKPIWDAIWWVITNVLAPVFQWLWREVIKPVWEKIRDGIAAAWRFIRDRVFQPIRNFINDKLVPAFRSARDIIGRIWEQIRSTASNVWDRITDVIRGAVNVAIRIINKIGDAIERVAGAIGIDINIRDIPELRERSGSRGRPGSGSSRATNQPGFHAMGTYDLAKQGSFVTNGPRAIVGEGRQSHPEAVIATDPQFRGRNVGILGWTANQLGFGLVPRFARGDRSLPRGPGISGLYDPLAAAVSRIITQGSGDVSITSGWRSRASQERLYRRYQEGRGNLAARPGSSKHEAGAAVDLGGNRRLYTRLAQAAGLVAPVRGEPWHWEHPDQGGGGGGGGLLSQFVGWIMDAAAGIAGLGDKFFDLPRKGLTWLRDNAVEWAKDQALQFGAQAAQRAGIVNVAGTFAEFREMGRQMNAARGWAQHWPYLDKLVMSESGWNPLADNPSSSAYGIGQFLDSTWGTVGGFKTDVPALQIAWMLDYIAERYGNPTAAWRFKDRHNYYAQGGVLPFLGSFQTGTDRVPHDGLAFLHRDEAVLDSSDAAMWRAAALGSQKTGRTFHQENAYYGITDTQALARQTNDDLAWMATVGSH